MDVNFRRINVDQYDTEKFLTLQDLVPPLPAVSVADMTARAQQVKGLLSQGNYQAALATGLEDPPYGGNDQVKVSKVS